MREASAHARFDFTLTALTAQAAMKELNDIFHAPAMRFPAFAPLIPITRSTNSGGGNGAAGAY